MLLVIRDFPIVNDSNHRPTEHFPTADRAFSDMAVHALLAAKGNRPSGATLLGSLHGAGLASVSRQATVT
jgi:hypothetical protein